VTSIGNSAFSDCIGLTSVTTGNNVTSIGNYAFYNCYKLIEVYNLSSLNIAKGSNNNGYVGYYALDVYTSKESTSKLHNVDDYILYEDGDTVYLMGYIGNQTELTLPDKYNNKNYAVYQYAFNNCSSLTSVTIGNNVTSIGNHAFYGCSKLTSVTIGDNVNSIGNYAFEFCHMLKNVTIPNSVTGIGSWAFYGCNRLMSVIIGNNVTNIGRNAFSGCDKLQYNEDEDAYYLGNDSNPYVVLVKIKSTSITSYTISFKTNVIYDSAFSGCSSLTSVNIKNRQLNKSAAEYNVI
jgi:hypothetical protein